MTTVSDVMAELERKGNPLRAKTFSKHGAPSDALFGVSVADLKVIARKLRGQQELAYELFETGNGDAMYLAGLVADGFRMTKRLLDAWARKASWLMISEYTVPWVAAESKHARDLALEWMKSRKESVVSSGWYTYSSHVTVTADEQLDLEEMAGLLERIEDEIDDAPNRVRYTMNGFVIAVGSTVSPLLKRAKATARKLGHVDVELGGTSCKVPLATEQIEKVRKLGRTGRKRK